MAATVSAKIELGLDGDNNGGVAELMSPATMFVGLRLHLIGNIGAYVGSDLNLLVPSMMIGTAVGVYDIPCAYALVTGSPFQHQPDCTLSRPPGGPKQSI